MVELQCRRLLMLATVNQIDQRGPQRIIQKPRDAQNLWKHDPPAAKQTKPFPGHRGAGWGKRVPGIGAEKDILWTHL